MKDGTRRSDLPRPRLRMITIRLTDEQHSDIARRAAEVDLSINEYALLKLGFRMPPRTGKVRGCRSQSVEDQQRVKATAAKAAALLWPDQDEAQTSTE